VCLAVALAGQWARGLWEPDEGRYAECAREIVATGDWLHLTLHGRPHLTKPPGTYWAIAAGLELFGRNEFGARFLLGVAFAACALLVRRLGTDLFDAPTGSRAGWMYLTMLLPCVAGNALTTDTFLTATQLAGFACVVRSWRSARPGPWLAAAGAAFGLAFFVKGPPLLLTCAGFAAGWAWVARRAFPAARIGSWAGLGLFLVLAFWWFVWMAAEDPSRADHWLNHEVVGRAVTTEHHRDNPWWLYPPLVAAGALPWTVQAARGVRALRGGDRLCLLACWVLVPLAGFCLFRSRLPFYVLPLVAPIALVAACGSRDPSAPLAARAPLLAAWCVVLVALRCAAAFVPAWQDCRAIDTAIRAADPDRRLPVALLADNPTHGLSFYLDGAVTWLDHPSVGREVWDETLTAHARRRAAAAQDWIAVAETGHAERAVEHALKGSAERCPSPVGWAIFRVHAKQQQAER
jgi:4-amino-4-deoxy-L-arabinose transferase